MPIEVKDITWSETKQYAVLNVPLKGAATKNVDIFTTNFYLKVSFPPYFYELALHNEVDEENSKATVCREQVSFHLKKKEPSLWGQLNSSEHKDKEFMKELRMKAVEYNQKKEEAKSNLRNTTKTQDKKYSVKQQMRIDSEEKQIIKDIKKEEAERMSREMDKWKNKKNKVQSKLEDIEEVDSLTKEIDINNNRDTKSTTEVLNSKVNDRSSDKKVEVSNSKDIVVENEKKAKEIPKPRASASIQVSFTPRVLPTPARESKAPEEELWLRKVAEYNKMKKSDNDDAVDIEERSPLWLKDKGNDFFKKGNYVAAINAYSSALMLDSKIPMIYSNRAACHLSLKQYKECIQDCTCALEFYDPPVPANALSRCRALSRRGAAFFELEEYVSALQDYENAIKLDPKNEELKKDATRIRSIIQGDE